MFGSLKKALGSELARGLSQELEKQTEAALGQVAEHLSGGDGSADGESRAGGAAGDEEKPPIVPLSSDCTGRKKAVFIGINYVGSRAELHGCHNDVKNVLGFITSHYGFKEEDVRVLMDEPGAGHTAPTKANILDALKWLAEGARAGDSLFLHYSGHGGTRRDEDGDEADGFDETILPVDFESTGEIIDDELHELVVRPLPQGVRLTAVFDSCHSGSVLDLPWSYKVDGSLDSIVQIDNRKVLLDTAMKAGMAYMQGKKKEAMGIAMEGVQTLMRPGGGDDKARRKAEKDKTTHGDIIMFSGCRDDQTSADAQIEGRPTGAASYALLRCLGEDAHQPYTNLLKNMRATLQGKYTQVPCLSTAHPMDLNVAFNC